MNIITLQLLKMQKQKRDIENWEIGKNKARDIVFISAEGIKEVDGHKIIVE